MLWFPRIWNKAVDYVTAVLELSLQFSETGVRTGYLACAHMHINLTSNAYIHRFNFADMSRPSNYCFWNYVCLSRAHSGHSARVHGRQQCYLQTPWSNCSTLGLTPAPFPLCNWHLSPQIVSLWHKNNQGRKDPSPWKTTAEVGISLTVHTHMCLTKTIPVLRVSTPKLWASLGKHKTLYLAVWAW